MAEVRHINVLRADRDNDNTLVSPLECLEDAAEDLRTGKRNCDKLLVLFLDSGPDGRDYGTALAASNMKGSEMIALLDITKAKIRSWMGY